MSAIDFVLQDKVGFVVSEDFESVGEEKEVELVEKKFKVTKKMEDSNKWDETYEANAYTAWN